jgi:amidase
MVAQDLCWLPALELAALIRQKKVSPVEVTDAALAQIERVNPTLNAYCAVTAEEARDAAQAAEVAVMTGEELGPLHGVPVSVKDLVFMRRVPTTGGSRLFADHVPEEDAVAVERLKGSGAVILGKTNTPEFGHKGVTDNPLFGITRNPWNPALTPGGSSGGAGAAVAAGMGPLALGTDGGGSIRIPAGCCGLFGLKPQRDRIPTAPMKEPWHGLSVYGPIVRHVADAARFIDATGDGEPLALAVERRPERLRIATSSVVVPPIMASPDAEQCGALDDMAALLRDLGHDVGKAEIPYGTTGVAFTTRYFRGVADEAAALPHPERLSRRTKGFRRMGAAIPQAALDRARAEATVNARAIATAFEHADVLMTPMFTRRPIPIGTYEGRGAIWSFNGYSRWVPYCAPFNHTGQPAASVPAGFTADGFPLAVQLVGRSGDEATLLSLAAQIEAERPWADRVPDL